jgi:hypothetical protein
MRPPSVSPKVMLEEVGVESMDAGREVERAQGL